jgi:GDP-D-mannose dehydratase
MIDTAKEQRSSDAAAWQSRFGKPKVMITGGLGLIGSLLEACRQLNPTARILFASTHQVYGRPS